MGKGKKRSRAEDFLDEVGYSQEEREQLIAVLREALEKSYPPEQRAMMNSRKAYYVGLHPALFRAGEKAEIIAVRMFTPEGGLPERACFVLRYKDGTIDFTPIGETFPSMSQHKIIGKK